MGSYRIEWRAAAEADLHRIDRKYLSAIIERVEALADEPFLPQSRKLKDRHGQRRLRVGPYRILYEVNTDARIVTIAAVGKREHFYR